MATNNTVDAAVSARNSEAEQQVSALFRNEEELSKTVVILEERLYQVLIATGPEAESKGAANQTEPIRVPLAETLNQHNSSITNLTRRLQSIINRIEL